MRYCGSRSTFVCFAVADGMGGLRDGAECAEITIAAFFDALVTMATAAPLDRLEKAMHCANSQVHLSKGGVRRIDTFRYIGRERAGAVHR